MTVGSRALTIAIGLVLWSACNEDGGDRVSASVERLHGLVLATADARVDIDVGGLEPETSAGDSADTEADTGPTDETEVAVAPDLSHPNPEPALLSQPVLDAIDVEMRAALDVPGLAGRTFGGMVIDIDTGQVVWQLDADLLLIPASNTKSFTTAAALDLLGADHRMLTRVFASAAIDAGGVLDGDLDLHSEHDFTWSRWFYADPRHPADRLADALWELGLRRVTGAVGVWGAYLYEGHHFASYSPARHRERAGDAFVAALTDRGIAVGGALADHATMALPPGRELARWTSIPLWVGAWPIMRKSHNEMADILLRHLGYAAGGSSDYATGEGVVRDWLAQIGADAAGFTISDGSGLSLANRISARHLVELYRAMAERPVFEAWRSSLSVAGAQGPSSTDADDAYAIVTENLAPYNGTLAWRMTGDDTAGRVFGKSGTNAGITTSGVLYHRFDGHRYAFAFLMNTLPSGTYSLARATQNALVAVVARDWTTAARPLAPTLGCVRARADGLVEVEVEGGGPLDPADERSGYALETSADGLVWRRRDALFSPASPLVLAPPPSMLYLRARAESSAGLSDPSDIYPIRVRPDGERVLLVDANDRWQRQPTNENPMGAAHAFMINYAAAVPEPLAIETCPNEAVSDDAVALAAYDAVIWATGEEAATDESIAPAEATRLADYLAIGGALFASGAEIGWDLDPRGNAEATAADTDFYRDWLSSAYAGDDSGVFVLEGETGSIFADLHHERRLGFWTPGAIFVAYPDEMMPAGSGAACMRYLGPDTIGCVASASEPAVVNLGIPFESIDSAAGRALVMERVLSFLGLSL